MHQPEHRTLEQRLAAAERDVVMWREISDRPSLSREASAAAHGMRRAAQARVALLKKAIDWQKTPPERRYPVHQLALARLLRVPLE
jgi:hypothetical protein